MNLESALFTGTVRHRRHHPARHAFSYRHSMVLLNLEELEQAFKGRWLWSLERANVVSFRRADYLGDLDVPLAEAVRQKVRSTIGAQADGAIMLLTTLRYFGYCFNPVSFYFCFDSSGRLLAIVSQITNTPWGERHAYVHDTRLMVPGEPMEFSFDKQFHVSPFMPMEMNYQWRFTLRPGQIAIHMNVKRNHEKQFDATLSLNRLALSTRNMAAALLRFPLMPLQMQLAIHWQALRLWLKRVPVHDHPNTSNKLARKDP